MSSESDNGVTLVQAKSGVAISKAALKKQAKRDFRKENGKKRERGCGRDEAPTENHRATADGHGRHAETLSAEGEIPTFHEMLKMTPQLTSSGKETTKPHEISALDVESFIRGLNGTKVGSLEIYARFPLAYDILMSFHDCQAVTEVIWDIINAENQFTGPSTKPISLLDIGCGTGRLSRLLLNKYMAQTQGGRVSVVGYDKYPHMLRVFHDRLLQNSSISWKLHPTAESMMTDSKIEQHNICLRPISFEQIGANGASLGKRHPRVDVVMMGWCLSYVMRNSWSDEGLWKANVSSIMGKIISECCKQNGSKTYIFVLETLGVGKCPSRNSPLIAFLVETWGFDSFDKFSTKPNKDNFVRTDYTFPSTETAKSLCKFFFAGTRVPTLLAENSPNGTLLPECSGIWVKKV